jgi:hypothetical protein
MTNTQGVVSMVAIAAAIFLLATPIIDEATDTMIGDAVITKTCWDRHGVNFISRWSCRSSFHRVGLTALALSCAFGGTSDLCENFREIKQRQPTEK